MLCPVAPDCNAAYEVAYESDYTYEYSSCSECEVCVFYLVFKYSAEAEEGIRKYVVSQNENEVAVNTLYICKVCETEHKLDYRHGKSGNDTPTYTEDVTECDYGDLAEYGHSATV